MKRSDWDQPTRLPRYLSRRYRVWVGWASRPPCRASRAALSSGRRFGGTPKQAGETPTLPGEFRAQSSLQLIQLHAGLRLVTSERASCPGKERHRNDSETVFPASSCGVYR
jgi:hypothetical protein